MVAQLRIAIQPDKTFHRNGEGQSYSEYWQKLAEIDGHEPVIVDVRSNRAVETIASCNAFMWRPSPTAVDRELAVRIISAIEEVAQIPCFFNSRMLCGFEDKVAQHYELSFAGLPTAKTEVFWTAESAQAYCKLANYPLVLKLANGYQSSNVVLINTYNDATHYIEMLFGPGALSLGYKPATSFRKFLRKSRQAYNLLCGKYPNSPNGEATVQHGYFYLQEYLPDNQFDTRVTIIGERAMAFRRFNREGDFRASGSGRIDFNQEAIDPKAIELAFSVTKRLKMPVAAVDIMMKNSETIVCEYNLSFATWAIKECPGYWVHPHADSAAFDYVEKQVEPEELIYKDFIDSILNRA